ncbi:CarD family transcriptional regulator [Rhodopseudomonas sp. HC1]|uniref:CarD family transcriptional regulator n=1 Tax=Rhodopseudomonas infernalis TaxID=2897386 RepID=UPI001EE8E334|nr:CarD family transcriptional regulator [Rhodopseudomonas infernalis]MCG6206182.1 CarD family transcriptional regulator [Rhodopseudomonas infernalis]
MCYIWHILHTRHAVFAAGKGSRQEQPTGAWRFHAQAVSQKTRKMSASSKGAKHAGSRSATNSRSRASKDARTTKTAGSKSTISKASVSKPSQSKTSVSKSLAAKAPSAKASAAKVATAKGSAGKASASSVTSLKSSKTKRSAMPSKTAKPDVAATVSKAASAKPAAKPAAKAPVAAAPKAAAKPEVKPVAAKPAAAPKVEEPKKAVTQRQGFKANEFVVYPAHGVGQILAIEEQEIAGAKLELFVINFIKDKMTLRVPTAKVANVGMRKLSDPALVKKALETLKGRARVKRTMWSRRAQEYEAKINSGDIVAIAEVVRDLYRSDSQPEQSYSERQLYEAALDRLSREIAVVQQVTETEAIKEVEGQLAKSPRRGAKADAEGEADADGDADGDSDDTVTDEAA